MDVLQQHVSHRCIPGASFDSDRFSHSTCDTTEVLAIKDCLSIQFQGHLVVLCPLDTDLHLCSLRRSCMAPSLEPVAIPCRILLPEPAAIIIPYIHAVSICIVSQVYAKAVTVLLS